jgi:hypothetical protein
MSASVSYADVERMLRACAPGFTVRRTTHSRSIRYGNLVYPSFPKHDEIELGYVRKMARHFGILECAKKHGVA